MEGPDFVGLADGHKARLRRDALIEGEDQRMVEARGVIGAGGVAEMVRELDRTRTPSKELPKLIIGGGRF